MTYRVVNFGVMPPRVDYQGESINKAFAIGEKVARETHRMVEVQMSGAGRWQNIQSYFYGYKEDK